MATRTADFQRVGDHRLDRKDHVWTTLTLEAGPMYKCVLCGALTLRPPPYPTPADWLPGRYRELTQADRESCPRT